MTEVLDIGIKVKLKTSYAVVCETLERIGIVNKKEKKIFPSCYCHKFELEDGSTDYRICHFKEMFKLEGKESTFSKVDRLRLQTIVFFMKRWNIIELVNKDDVNTILEDHIDVVSHADKKDYQIVHKFRYSKKRNIEKKVEELQ